MMAGELSVGVPEVFAGSARWAASAASFTDVSPPEVGGAWPSAMAVGAIHGVVAASHAQFGARLAQTAEWAQQAGMAYTAQDVEQNAKAFAHLVSEVVQP